MVRRITKIRRNIKAISPVISVLLMIAVAVVASLVVYAWVMGFVGTKTNQVGKAIQIQSVALTSTGLSVYTQNVGDSNVAFSSPCIYINGTAAATSFTASPTLGQQLSTGSTESFTGVTLTGITIKSGDTVTVKVASTDGTFSQVTQSLP
jgi:flagellin-like protein